VAFIASHYEVDFAEHYLGPLLAERGYGFLGWNTRFRGNEAYFLLEPALADIDAGIRWLRDVQGVEVVVLLGNSGGGSLMAAYQAQLGGGDLYISLNAHAGRPEVLTAWLDPSVLDETDPLAIDPALDMFDGGHGPPYSPSFVSLYRAAQRARNDRITAWAHTELDRLAAGGLKDRLFVVHRNWADPRFLDLTLDPSDRQVGCYAGDPRRANAGPFGLARASTLRTWLAMWSLAESPCRGELHLPAIEVPALVVQSLADRGVYPSDARAIHAALGAANRSLELVPGEHYLEDGTRSAVADLIAAWTAERAG
jgi:pimeloyl-ACP methyl ester carboxylesterase